MLTSDLMTLYRTEPPLVLFRLVLLRFSRTQGFIPSPAPVTVSSVLLEMVPVCTPVSRFLATLGRTANSALAEISLSIVLFRNLRCLQPVMLGRLREKEWRASVRMSRLGSRAAFNVLRSLPVGAGRRGALPSTTAARLPM